MLSNLAVSTDSTRRGNNFHGNERVHMKVTISVLLYAHQNNHCFEQQLHTSVDSPTIINNENIL